jgi:hypothetical protein
VPKKLVALEIVFEVPGRETMPVGQPSFYCCPRSKCRAARRSAPRPLPGSTQPPSSLLNSTISRLADHNLMKFATWRGEPKPSRSVFSRSGELSLSAITGRRGQVATMLVRLAVVAARR